MSDRFKMTRRALHRLVESVKEKRYEGIYDVQSFFGGLWKSSMEVLVILMRIWNFKSPNSSCLNYYQKNYGCIDWIKIHTV